VWARRRWSTPRRTRKHGIWRAKPRASQHQESGEQPKNTSAAIAARVRHAKSRPNAERTAIGEPKPGTARNSPKRGKNFPSSRHTRLAALQRARKIRTPWRQPRRRKQRRREVRQPASPTQLSTSSISNVDNTCQPTKWAKLAYFFVVRSTWLAALSA